LADARIKLGSPCTQHVRECQVTERPLLAKLFPVHARVAGLPRLERGHRAVVKAADLDDRLVVGISQVGKDLGVCESALLHGMLQQIKLG
jgi:hypothetical protein